MTRGARLCTLLRTFRLPPEATLADLRQAYFREAKRLHPDLQADCDRHQATQSFTDLRHRFEEAAQLLEAPPSRGDTTAGGQATCRSHAPQQNWEDFSYRFRPEYRAKDTFSGHTSVPVVGLPSPLVHALTSATLVVAGLLLVFTRRRDGQDDVRTDPHNTLQLRRVLEGGGQCSVVPATSAQHGNYAKDTEAPHEQRVLPTLDLDGHAAADQGHVWWLERCGASSTCRASLGSRDWRGDTVLHRCAQSGRLLACKTLLRLRVDPSSKNNWGLWPEDLAAQMGHREMATLLRTTRIRNLHRHANASAPVVWGDEARHPDGLGVFIDVPTAILYDGPHESESLLHALNYAAGHIALTRERLDEANNRSPPPTRGGFGAAEQALNHVRLALAGGDTELEAVPACANALKHGGPGWATRADNAEVVGLLVFEPPGSVTSDAHGHWAAIRPTQDKRIPPTETSGVACSASLTQNTADVGSQVSVSVPQTLAHVALDGSSSIETVAHPDPDEDTPVRVEWPYIRLDSVRGAFGLCETELATLLMRYAAWRVVRLRN